MDVAELLSTQADLESDLQQLGPIGFLRELLARCHGEQVLARDAEVLPGNRRATRFLFVDLRGDEALLTIFSEILPDGTPTYSLMAELRGAA